MTKKTSPVNKSTRNNSTKAKGVKIEQPAVKTSQSISIEQKLAQREAELAIINSVQEGLSRKLDLQEIVDLVGEKIGENFSADTVSVGMYDAERDWSVNLYYVDRGQRIPLGDGPAPRPSLTAIVVDTREPLLIGTLEESGKLGARRIPRIGEEEDKNESYLGVPIMVGEKVIGVTAVQSYKQNAFNQNDLRLLQTLANSMSVALENARLFDETQRLLKETEDRAAELIIINSVQEGLASKLEMQAIYDLVGAKIGEIFNADSTYISTYDRENKIVHPQYAVDRGYHLKFAQPFHIGQGYYTHVIQTRKPLIINTTEQGSGLGGIPTPRPDTGEDLNESYLGVPLMLGDEVKGIVAIQSYKQYAFDESDARLLTTLANSMSVALENARLFDETQRLFKAEQQRAAELATVNTVSNALAGELDLSALIELVGEQIRTTFKADIAYVALLDEASNTINFPYQYGERQLASMQYGEGLTSKIIQSAKPLLINQDIEKRRAELGVTQVGIQARSYLGVPIFVSGKAIGVVSVQSTVQEDVFTENDQRLLGTIAANVGVALQNAHLFDEIQTRNREITEALEQQIATSEILQVIASSPTEIQPVLDVIAQNAVQLSGSDDALIDIEDKGILRVAAHYGNIPMFPVGEGIPLNRDSVAGRAIMEGHTLQALHKQPGQESEYPEGDKWAQKYGYRMTCSVPLLREGKAIGAITIRRLEPNLLNEKEIALIETFASQAVIAIENVRLFNELQTRNREITEALEQQTATSDILAIIAENPTDVQPVLDAVAERAARLCNSYDAVIARVDGNSYQIAAHWGPVPIPVEILNNGVLLNRDTVTGRAMMDRKTIHIHDLLAEPTGEFELSKEFYQTSKQRTMLVTPLMRENEVIGAIMIRRREVNPFTDKQVALLKIFADQAAIAIENVRLFDEVTRRKEYFEALFQNNPVAVVTTDTDAIVTSWNPAAEKLFGYTREEVIGKTVDDLVANREDLHAEAVRYSRVLNPGGNAFRAIVKRTRKDGSLVDVELSAVPIIVQGKKQGSYALYHDITELLRARQEAIAANEAKSSFLATMSHEIRTPMNAVIGMSGLLMDTELNREQRDYAETIRNSGDALLAIINDILDFSKIEAGKMDVEHQPFDLRECVESALDLTAGRAIEKGLDIAYMMDDDVPAGIKSDVTRLRQILINLLSNAIKFTENGEVVLTVSVDKEKSKQVRTSDGSLVYLSTCLRFSVRDTGIGISEGHISRLFQSFSQADSSTTRRFGGTGLGLAISKRLAEMMGGEMHAESAGIGKGSTFIFTIKAEPAKVAERKTARDLKGIQSTLQDKHVLIVDDNATNRRILALQTEKWGMSARETEHPNEALKWLKDGQHFDLAILDLQMPEMDGIMLTREIRELRDEKSLPVILLTSLGRREIGADDLEFAAYLTKPLKPSHLYDALAGLFATSMISPKVDSAKPGIDVELGKRHPLRILLAEDNAVNQKLALRILEQMGYRADVASNGLESVESIERQIYDVILMDVQMPEMDGLDATREIRKLVNATQPYIIAMTANAMEGDREMCIAAGMNDYISKPIRVNELVDALMKAERK